MMFFENRQPIETAPRDGTLIIVGHEDVGTFIMRWNPKGSNALVQPEPSGIWEARDGSITWSERGDGGPGWWRRIDETH